MKLVDFVTELVIRLGLTGGILFVTFLSYILGQVEFYDSVVPYSFVLPFVYIACIYNIIFIQICIGNKYKKLPWIFDKIFICSLIVNFWIILDVLMWRDRPLIMME